MIVVSTTLAQTDISQYLYFTDMDFYLFIFFTDIQSGGRNLLIFAISEFSCSATMRLSFFCFHSNNSISIEWIAMEFDIYVPQLNPNGFGDSPTIHLPQQIKDCSCVVKFLNTYWIYYLQ